MKNLLLILWLCSVTLYSYGQKPCACCDSLHRQFDFWVGSWVVKDTAGKVLGHNEIALIQDSCALKESWTGASQYTGTSLSYYNKNQNRWNQYWVDAFGGSVEMSGSFHSDRMIMVTETLYDPKKGTYTDNRTEWIIHDKDVVHHVWKQSTDGGQTWTVVFDGYYYRK